MANEVHFKILKQGVKAWNQWREKNSAIWPDLIEANLTRANLTRANLSKANLSKANLYNADLSVADLTGANLSKANLSKADLTRANLTRANLSGANLNRANLFVANLSVADLTGANLGWAKLSKANLSGANLSRADLNGADLNQTQVGLTTLGDVDLSTAKNLDNLQHVGPSIIGIDSIYRSEGNIPQSFLVGAGVPDDFITYMKSLVGKAIEFYFCFISYSSNDQEFAERLYADLQSNNVRTWFAPEDMKIGEDIWDTIDKAIHLRDKLLLILSENSIESAWVEDEVKKAFAEEHSQKRKILFPVRLDGSVMDSHKPWATKIRENRHIGDFRQWKNHDSYQKSFNRLLRDLKTDEIQSAQ